MKYLIPTLFLLFSIFLLWPSPSNAQNADTTATKPYYRIETTKGNTVFGQLISEDSTQVILQSDELGRITLQRSMISKLEIVDPGRLKDGVYWFKNPNATHYLFTTNARSLGAGHGYYQNTWVFYNSVNVGFTDNISMGGGIIPLFLFGASATPVWLLPKISIPIQSDKLYLSGGAMLGGILGGSETHGLGVVYGVATAGSADNNISVGLGYGYVDQNWSSTPTVNISFMLRGGRSLYLVSENYFVNTGGSLEGIISGGLRWAGENFSVDLAILHPTGSNFIGIPWLGVTLPFGK